MYIGSKSVYQGKHRWVLIVLAALPLFLVAGLRYGIGTDYFSYVGLYRGSYGKWNGKMELLYYLLNHFLINVGLGEQWLFIVCSAIYTLAIFTYVYKESPNPIFSIYLFMTMTFYFSFFNTMRQNLACAILLFSIPYVRKKKFIPFLIIVTIAGLIHTSAFAFAFVYLFAYVKLTPKKTVVIAVAFLALRGLAIQQIVNIITDNQFLHYETYLEGMDTTAGFSIENILGILVQLAILVVATIGYKKDDEKYRIYYSIQLMALLIIILGNSIPLINRIKWMFSYQSIILLPLAIGNFEKRSGQLIKLGTGIAFAIYCYVVIAVTHSYNVIPYTSIFSQ